VANGVLTREGEVAAIGIHRSRIATIVLAAVLLAAALYCSSGHRRYAEEKERFELLSARVKVWEERKKALDDQEPALVRSEAFMGDVRRLRLRDADWVSYPVNLDLAVSPETLSALIPQCAHHAGYYFEPETLHIKTRPEAESPGSVPTGADAPLAADLRITLKGFFLARE